MSAQTFFKARGTKYFAIREPVVENRKSPPSLSLSQENELDSMEIEDERRLLLSQENAPALDEELEHDQNTDWLRDCGWPTWFAGKSLLVIVTAASL